MKVLDLVLKILNLVKVNNFKDTPTTISGWKSEKTVLDKIITENNSGRKEKTHRS